MPPGRAAESVTGWPSRMRFRKAILRICVPRAKAAEGDQIRIPLIATIANMTASRGAELMSQAAPAPKPARMAMASRRPKKAARFIHCSLRVSVPNMQARLSV